MTKTSRVHTKCEVDGEIYEYSKILCKNQGEYDCEYAEFFEKIEELEQDENAFPPIQVLQALYSKNLLKADSRITSMKLGFSTLVQLTQTQVFAPTWEVSVRTDEGVTEEYFVDAVEGKVIEVSIDSIEMGKN